MSHYRKRKISDLEIDPFGEEDLWVWEKVPDNDSILKLKTTDNFIEFSLDYMGDCEYVEMNGNDINEERNIVKLIKRLVKYNNIFLGERTEGTIKITDEFITLDYKVCVEVGEDWDSDVYEEYHEDIPNN